MSGRDGDATKVLEIVERFRESETYVELSGPSPEAQQAARGDEEETDALG
jgi:hypothetical protein